MDLRNKKLLLLGGSAFAKDIKKYSKEKGFSLFSIGRNKNAEYMKIADKSYNIDFMNFSEVTKIINQNKIDGFFGGAAEESIDAAISLSELSGVPFYTNRKQWNVFSNKRIFKETVKKYNIPVIKDYIVHTSSLKKDIESIVFPVMIKPADSSGARGNNVAYNKNEFLQFFNDAIQHSNSKEVIVEELITDAQEFFLKYLIQDGRFNLISGFTKHKANTFKKFSSIPLFHIFPSSYIKKYKDLYEEKFIEMFKDMEVKNGILILQAFVKNNQFLFIEAGYRMGGAQIYKFTEHQNNFNFLELMINLALSENMEDYDLGLKANPFFEYPCCNYYIPLKRGKIKSISGIEQVENMVEVLNVTKMRNIGDLILDDYSLERISHRLHVWGKSKEQLAQSLVKISNTIKILDEFGNDMQLEKLKYKRCLKAISNS